MKPRSAAIHSKYHKSHVFSGTLFSFLSKHHAIMSPALLIIQTGTVTRSDRSCNLSQHVDGLPGGRNGSDRVEGADGDVSDRETAQKGENVINIQLRSFTKD